MANEEHLILLRQGVETWNAWREKYPDIKPDLRVADLNRLYLKGANLSEANLSVVNFSGAYLRGANLNNAYLRGANLKSTNLSLANLKQAHLNMADLRGADLSETNLKMADLSEANLYLADLRGADLSRADLFTANFSRADLFAADLSKTQALNTNFNEAILTGACIEDWNINSATQLDSVICDYIYLKNGSKERYPKQGNFALNGFTQHFQKSLEIADFIFLNSVE